MFRTLAGATALALVWGPMAAAQAPERPGTGRAQDQQQSGQLRAGQQQAGDQGQQQTVRGRIIAISDTPQAGRQEEGNPGLGAGQSSAQAKYITVMGWSGGQGQSDRPGAAAESRTTPGQGDQGQMRCIFRVTEETRIDTPTAGQAGSESGPGGDQDQGQAEQLGQGSGQQEYRGLKVGQIVEVSYRPMGGQGGLADLDQPDRGDQDQPTRTSQGQTDSTGRTVRGEAVSIRVHAETGQGSPDQPGPGALDTGTSLDRPIDNNP